MSCSAGTTFFDGSKTSNVPNSSMNEVNVADIFCS
ncbi:hypothetical protein IL54_2714 [Sphingobium sp. ba1]|nr:hypothetical protein IL54_2714 [Sphingobium sp. ba1]